MNNKFLEILKMIILFIMTICYCPILIVAMIYQWLINKNNSNE